MYAIQLKATVRLHECIAAEPTAVPQARESTETACAELLVELANVTLVVTELITNAVVHGLDEPISLWICRHVGLLWVEVDNGSQPRSGLLLLCPSDDATSGRGLLIAMRFSETLWAHVGDERMDLSAAFVFSA
ncbi:ATP-binding protein [Streptomycetaceae bacterium NBC_01309]